MEIQELPDYKERTEKYFDEPLFEYVQEVADMFMPDYDGEHRRPSTAPFTFANRYIESTLTDDEKYARFIEIFPDCNLDYAKDFYAEKTKLNTSFKELFLSKKEVLKTLKMFKLDLSKFWYLLLFVNDLVEDICINAPSLGLSEIDKVNEMVKEISEATEIIIAKKDCTKNYKTQDENILSVLKASINHFVKTYNNILSTSKDNKECKARLKELGLNNTIKSLVPIHYEEEVSLDKSHRTRLFAEMFSYFLRNREADRGLVEDFNSEDSTEKMLLISRLAYIVGLQGEDYYKRIIVNKKGRFVANRRLSNLLSRYRNEPLPPTTARQYPKWY